MSVKNSFISSLIITVFACAPPKHTEVKLIPDFHSEIENKIDSVLAQLTLEEKVRLTHANSMFTSTGVPRLGIPELNHVDGPTGVREEMERNSWKPLNLPTDSATFFPAGPSLAATWNEDLAVAYGVALGEETRARGKDVLLGPSINIIRTPISGRNFEYFTEDPFLNSRIAVGYVKGIQSRDAAACVKHYIANNQEWMRNQIDVQMDERALREIYFPAYRAAVEEAGALAFMGAYNKVRGEYCCENQYLLNDVLKKEWGFEGVVISDWGATHSTVDAAMKGLDIEMGSRGGFDKCFFGQKLIDSVKAGAVPEEVINDKARRILRVMFRCKTMDKNRHQGSLSTPAHFKTAYNVAKEAIVLMKNSENVLPLNLSEIKKIAVIGENATEIHGKGGFGAGVKTKYEITPLEGLKRKIGSQAEIVFAQGFKKQFRRERRSWWRAQSPENAPDSSLIAEAVAAAKSADVAIIFAGSNRNIESEARDRQNMDLPFGQVELINAITAANPKTVVVMLASAPYDLVPVEESMSTLLWGWFNGSESGTALADVIFGDVNPSGKLPFTMPVKLEDSPAHALEAYPGTRDSVVYKEGILVGYRWFDTKKIEPLYCFGHGLSYTSFEFLDVKTNKSSYKNGETIDFSVKLKNTGKVAGAEVVQLYVSDPECSVLRPAKELKGFSKIFLEPGETETVHIQIPVKNLAFYDDQQMAWVVEPGRFELLVGASSRDVQGKAVVEVN